MIKIGDMVKVTIRHTNYYNKLGIVVELQGEDVLALRMLSTMETIRLFNTYNVEKLN